MTSDEEEIRALRQIALNARQKGKPQEVLFEQAAAKYGVHKTGNVNHHRLVLIFFVLLCIAFAIMVMSYS